LISRPTGGLVSFILHKYFTFQNRGAARITTQFGRFWMVWILSFLVSQSLIWYFSRILEVRGVPTKVMAECVAALLSFLCQRFWTFSHRAPGGAS
jgi:putative flippase GtrA